MPSGCPPHAHLTDTPTAPGVGTAGDKALASPSPANANATSSSGGGGGGGRSTVGGQECLFPATFQGGDVYDCVMINGAEMCQARLRGMGWGVGVCVRVCGWRGEPAHLWVHGAIARSLARGCDPFPVHMPRQTATGAWAECAPAEVDAAAADPGASSPGTPQITSTDGQACLLPLTYHGAQVGARACSSCLPACLLRVLCPAPCALLRCTRVRQPAAQHPPPTPHLCCARPADRLVRGHPG